MSYQVLARKWRPKTFAEVVGQQHILTALANGLKQNRLHHAYLFSGTRGVGKTSIARLFAKGLNCVKGVTAEPCGECEHCKAIEQGRFIDLIEIDAASRTKVEDTRELLDNVQYKPVEGRYKVYLIDEVHMLSRHSFNALLKTLEEPPEYVKFLLATTDPHKLPITILSRCMQFHLKALEPAQISLHLEKILSAEHIDFDVLALERIAKSAQGSIRDSLSLTDQAIAMGNGEVRLDTVNQMLGLLDENQALNVIRALHRAAGDELMQVVQEVASKGGDWEQFLIEISELLHKIALCQLLPESHYMAQDQIALLAKQLSPEDVQFYYQIIITGRKELNLAPDYRTGVEMTLLRALAFHPKQFSSSSLNQESTMAMETSSTASSTKALDSHTNIKTAKENNVKPIENPVAVEVPVVSQQSLATQSENPAHSALTAIENLRDLSRNMAQKEKKNLTENKALLDVPVIDVGQSTPKKDLATRLNQLADQAKKNNASKSASTQALSTQNQSAQHSEQISSLEQDYRWEWINPEMAQVDEGIRPSEIKRAILQEKTQELIDKVVSLTAQRDPWAKMIEELQLEGFVKQLALHSVLLSQQNQQIKLGIRPEQAHLNKEKCTAQLQQSLTDYYQHPIDLIVEPYATPEPLTPMEHRQNIYRELQEQAKQHLLADEKVALLIKEFDGTLDLDSIRPV
ncbi:DNA polymerase III gamma subunit /DNA polymerase III tau subunit [Volucribacter psittacicida]|uniref:DNA polymerase III subunit gamma/tau n=1 Tax=Volucribacter psittacicida TaxID=203482 RepID=A0A4R1FKT0_9PAST|nr:DNA polymerase III subunit gamma/tau [Volucribacter psittacicida]TCJ93972.1 DNA polymerase III gamma subunit /DNA polymerase III tau subunit [Volucribacter psittacicida]